MSILALVKAVIVTWLAIYGAQAIVLLLLFLRHRKESPPTPPHVGWCELPHVTVQVPVYNELHVVERVIDRVAALTYPRDKLHIQILDDSNDETLRLSRARAALHRERGIDIEVLRRPERSGYKAGALAWGVARSHSEYFAVFDADFCPRFDFLLQTIPHFLERPRLGVVQTRWAYLNTNYTPLTEAQAIAFDGHFGIEQVARCRSGLFMNFNGTGGVWRRQCIEEAGGWEGDTLTEDLDLSYRAQLEGWEFLYLPDVVVQAELTPQITAFKRQQFRWSQGTTQTLRKLAGRILRSPNVGWGKKLMGLLHLGSYLTHGLIIMHLLITLPMLLVADSASVPLESVFGVLGLGPPIVFIVAQWQLHPDWWRRLRAFPLTMLLVVGIAWCSARATWRGLTQWGGAFVRTPKFRIVGKKGGWTDSQYRLRADVDTIGEILLSLYALAATILAFLSGHFSVVPFTLLYAVALGMMAGMGLAQTNPEYWRNPLRFIPLLDVARHRHRGSDG
jgi:cellulose synthase/poly-beta-1,6-N-acetylglucosamine synthase-like glycosyltransferase